MKIKSAFLKQSLHISITALLAFVLALTPMLSQTVASASPSTKANPKQVLLDSETERILEEETRKSFDFFWNETNTDPKSPGYGLIRDRAPGDEKMSSVASVGFGLSAIVIGAERGYITKKQAEERILGTLNTMLNNAEQVNGFFYHFLDMDTAKRYGGSEVSVIDTAILVSGAISAGEYFGGEIKEKAEQLYKNVDWNWYLNPNTNQFYMSYSPEHGFSGAWDFYGEQFMLYFLGAASPTHPVNSDTFYDFIRNKASYGGYPEFIHSWFGSIFTHQFSYAWFDLRNKVDEQGVNWWDNSVIATKSSRQYAIDLSNQFKTYGPNSWGFTAADGPQGYQGRYGSAPSGYNNDQHIVDGTVPPAGAIGSIVFAPEEVLGAMRHYDSIPGLKGKYGFQDSYNLDVTPVYYGEDVIGIDKGISILMIENYRTGLIWDLMNQNKYVQAGMKMVGLTPLGTQVVDNFEGNNMHDGWSENPANRVYTLQETNEDSYTGLKSMQVSYDKKGKDSSSFSPIISNANFDGMDTLSAFVKGNVKFKIKFESDNPLNTIEKDFHVSGNSWNKLLWEFSETEKVKLKDAKRMQFFVEPGAKNKKGTFYIDDIQFTSKRPMGTNPLVEGKLIVGENLASMYSYADTDGNSEGKTRYQWLSAPAPDGKFDEISGANASHYTPAEADRGQYLKVAITPVNSKGIEGTTITSPAYGPVEGPEPEARNVTITTVPFVEQIPVDNFDGESIIKEWADSGDKAYKLTLDSSITTDGTKAMRVDYNKGSTDWAFITGTVKDGAPYFQADELTMKINGKVSLLMKLEKASTKNGPEIKFDVDTQGEWQTVKWDLSQHRDKLGDVERVLLFADPGKMNNTGTFYLDDIKVSKTNTIDLTTGAAPVVGQAVYGSYNYFDAYGHKEAGTSYQWYRADSHNGPFKAIEGANKQTYIPQEEDLGKFLKFEVIPRKAEQPATGKTVQSAASKAITTKQPAK